MRKVITLTLALCLVASFSFAQIIDLSTAKSGLDASSTNLDQLLDKVNNIKKQAEANFASEETALQNQKVELQQRRTSLEAGNANEKNMKASEWPARVAAREALVRDEAKVAYNIQLLAAKKADFQHRIKQIEQHVQSTFVEVIRTQNQQNESVMKSYLNSLNGFQM